MKRRLTGIACGVFLVLRAWSADPVLEAVAESLSLLRDQGVAVDAESARRALVGALVRTADPGGRLLESLAGEETDPEQGEAATALREERLPGEIVWLRIAGLPPGAGEGLAGRLLALQEEGLFGVIVDLRGASGGEAVEAAAAAAPFHEEGEALFRWREPGGGEELPWVTAAGGARITFPVLALVDRHTGGAPELLAALWADLSGGVLLMGGETAGDPLLRRRLPLSWGMDLEVVSRTLETASGVLYDGRGSVRPHVAAAAGTGSEAAEGERTGEEEEDEEAAARERLRLRIESDPALRRARDLLLGLRALEKEKTRS